MTVEVILGIIFGCILLSIGILLLYSWRNPKMKEGKNGSFDPLGHSCFNVAFARGFALLLIAIGIIMIFLL